MILYARDDSLATIISDITRNYQTRLDFAKANAQVYGVEDKITFILGDFRELAGMP